MSKIEFNKTIALLDEIQTSSKLIKLGFGELQNITLENDFYFLPFQLLSQGFERFLKAYICIGYYEKNSSLPDFKYLKKLGHDIELLLNEVMENYFLKFNTPQYEEDKEFLLKNDDLKKLLFILSEFGKVARYHNFDVITDATKVGINATSAWQTLESEIMKKEKIPYEKLLDPNLNHEVFQQITSYIIVIFEKFISALSRQFIFNNLGATGKSLATSNFLDFGILYENDFGKTDYRKNTTRYTNSSRRVHRRNIIDVLNRRFNKNYKSKKLFKTEYPDDWPFYANSVVIECRHKHYCIVTIEGRDYALNGSAKGMYKLEDAHNAGVAILGLSVSNFIRMALDL